jgi:mannose-6-phosphate isomerase-like protein (cupin superfamily)
MAKLEKRDFSSPDETRKMSRSKMEIVKIGGRTITKATYEPGWRWSVDTKPVAGTKSCMRHHYGYIISGKLHVKSDDGTEMDQNPGDMVDIPPGHDGWTSGNEPVVLLDFGDPCNCV